MDCSLIIEPYFCDAILQWCYSFCLWNAQVLFVRSVYRTLQPLRHFSFRNLGERINWNTVRAQQSNSLTRQQAEEHGSIGPCSNRAEVLWHSSPGFIESNMNLSTLSIFLGLVMETCTRVIQHAESGLYFAQHYQLHDSINFSWVCTERDGNKPKRDKGNSLRNFWSPGCSDQIEMHFL